MQNKNIKTDENIKVSETALLSLVSSKLKERVLFPKKIETAKDFLKNLHLEPLEKI